jgi:acetyltransferase
MLASIAQTKRIPNVTRNPAQFKIRDGRVLTLRLIRASDASLLERFFNQLSPEARWRRFHTLTDALPAERIIKQAVLMADVDNRRHEGAIVAVTEESGNEQIVGVVRLARPSGSSTSEEAEAAIVVLDAFQGLGVGGRLLQHMVQLACHMRIKRIVAVFQGDNANAIRLFRNLGLPSEMATSHGFSEMSVTMPG